MNRRGEYLDMYGVHYGQTGIARESEYSNLAMSSGLRACAIRGAWHLGIIVIKLNYFPQ